MVDLLGPRPWLRLLLREFHHLKASHRVDPEEREELLVGVWVGEADRKEEWFLQ